ncbi:MAG: ribonuclease III [Ruminococcus sp.]|jgi:ribonuclease-3 family protein|nr:ribonuclease III [Ruminococcus sp.]
MTDEILKNYSPLSLAFLGDGVYELLVREMIVSEANRPVGELHKMAVTYVKASFQAAAADKISESLTETEADIYRRGRNANGVHIPKSASPAEYRKATGFEAVFGYLYLKGDRERIEELFKLIIS